MAKANENKAAAVETVETAPVNETVVNEAPANKPQENKPKAAKAPKKYMVYTPVKNYCGIGAGGVQFANGKAEVYEGVVLNWFKEHGYTVEPVE